MATEVYLSVIIVFSFFMLRFITEIIATILMAYQRPSLSGPLIRWWLSFLMIICLRLPLNSLIYIALVFSATPALVPLFASFWFFKTAIEVLLPLYDILTFLT